MLHRCFCGSVDILNRFAILTLESAFSAFLPHCLSVFSFRWLHIAGLVIVDVLGFDW